MPQNDEIYVPHVGWLTYEEGDDVLRYLREGWFEYAEQAFLWLYLRESDVVIDCGAHVGLYSALASAIMQNRGVVIAVEPHPDTAELLKRNIKNCGATRARIVQAALSSEAGSVLFYPGGPTRSAYSSLMPEEPGQPGIPVTATTLDALCEAQGVERIDFLKIDAEGSELQVLEGATETIRNGQLPVMMVEFTESNLRRVGLDTKTLFEEILARGYVISRFDPDLRALIPIQYEAPIGYENYFATTDLAMVNQRLGEAPANRQRIARDVVRHGAVSYELKAAGLIRRISSELENAQSDQAAKETVIAKLAEQLRESESDRTARLAEIRKLEQDLDETEKDRAARLEVIHKLERSLNESETDRAARLRAIQKLQQELNASEAERIASQKKIDLLSHSVEEAEAGRTKQAITIEALRTQLAAQSAILAKLPIRILKLLGIVRYRD
jgi:FkbM family methyltransferase